MTCFDIRRSGYVCFRSRNSGPAKWRGKEFRSDFGALGFLGRVVVVATLFSATKARTWKIDAEPLTPNRSLD